MTDHLAVVSTEAARIVDLLYDADLSAPVPFCPGWRVSDLVEHLGGVHRWATAALSATPHGPAPREDEPPTGLDNSALAAWFARGADVLTAALTGDPDRPCWTFAPPQTAAFWVRRQAHETTVHRWDLESALGEPTPIDDELALDGIEEVVSVLLPRQVRLARIPATTTWVQLDVADRSFVVSTTGERDERPVARVAGAPHDVLLALWGRGGGTGISVDGDRDVLDRFLDAALTP